MNFEEIKKGEAREVNGGRASATIIKIDPPKWDYSIPVVPMKNEIA